MFIPAPAKTSGAYPKTAMDMDLSARKLDKMIEEATVDCYDELEQASGFYTMIEDHLAVPFATQVLGVEVSVVGVEMDDNGSLKAVCERNGKRQLIGLIDLHPLRPHSSSHGRGSWWPPFKWLLGRSGASRSSSPAIPTSVNRE